MSLIQLISEKPIHRRTEVSLWDELIGIGKDGLPLPKGERLSLYGLVQRLLRAKGRLANFAQREVYGSKASIQRQQIGLTLCNLWLHRMLISFQLEKKLTRIHGGDKTYRFLEIEQMKDWKGLNHFFLQILPQPIMFRTTPYSYVPPLEIPLFEKHLLEDLLSMDELDAQPRTGKQLLAQILNCLHQQDEAIINEYHLNAPVPAEHAFSLGKSLLESWQADNNDIEHQLPSVCDPYMLNADLLLGMSKAWMEKLFPDPLATYEVSAGPGGFNRHVPQKVQDEHREYYQTMARFVEDALFGVSPNAINLSWVKVKLWTSLLQAVPLDAASNYEHFFPLPKLRHKLCYGPSLTSQYRLDSKMTDMLKGNKVRWRLYCSAINMYQESDTEKEKEEARAMLEDMQKNFRSRMQASHPDFQRLKRLERELIMKDNPLFAAFGTPESQAKQMFQKEQLQARIADLKKRIEGQMLVKRTFEWRFHFPERLVSKDASFLGFDLTLLHVSEPDSPESAAQVNKMIKVCSSICKKNGLLAMVLPDDFYQKKAFQQAKKIISTVLTKEEENYVDGQGFEEICTGKLLLKLRKSKESLEI